MTDRQKRGRVRRVRQIRDLQEFEARAEDGLVDPLTRGELEAVEKFGRGKLWPGSP